MKWLGYVLSVIVLILLILMLPTFAELMPILIVSLYGGLFIYWALRRTWDDRISSIKKIAIVGSIITVLLIIEGIIINNVVNRLQAMPGYGELWATWLVTHSILSVIGIGAVFIAVPALLAFLEGLTKPDREGLIRNSIMVFVLVLLTLGIYQIYWFWLIKKGLRSRDIQTTSLWWFLLPIVGTILIYVGFSKALEKITQRKFIVWFLIFFFFSGLDVVINQAILNHDLLTKKA